MTLYLPPLLLFSPRLNAGEYHLPVVSSGAMAQASEPLTQPAMTSWWWPAMYLVVVAEWRMMSALRAGERFLVDGRRQRAVNAHSASLRWHSSATRGTSTTFRFQVRLRRRVGAEHIVTSP